MKHLKLFENFEVVEPIKYGESLNSKEIKFLEGYNIPFPEFILKDDNYYYVYDHRCEKIKDVPLTYIHGVCSKFYIRNYTINEDMSIDVKGNVFFSARSLNKIPLKFNKVSRDFGCSHNKLTTLEGAPNTVGGRFYCGYNQLTNLEGGPNTVGGDFDCSYNQLTSLEGAPKYVGGDLDCSYNQLTGIDGIGEVKGGIFITK